MMSIKTSTMFVCIVAIMGLMFTACGHKTAPTYKKVQKIQKIKAVPQIQKSNINKKTQ